jgi:aminoglycoside phosphotransferase (APT) family kinase protein
VEFRRRRPSPETLRWVEQAAGARVVAWRRMTGGIMSAVHRLTVERHGKRCQLVLRQFEEPRELHRDLVSREAPLFRDLHSAGLAAPELAGVCANGDATGSHPSILMTRLPGRIHLMPEDRDDWLRQIARTAAAIHNAHVAARAFQGWIDRADLAVPDSASDPRVCQAMIRVLREPGHPPDARVIHGDFQHFNFLWQRGVLTGVVDWAMASTGPPDLDVGHCRLNLAVLFGAEAAEGFRLAYETEAGRAVDPWWDLHAVAAYNDSWRQFIPVQVADRAPVDTEGMTQRVEDLLDATLRRL